HRYPFLLVDRVVSCTKGERLLAYKNVTFNEEFFNGHFPNNPVMPGVLVIEAMAQAGALLAYLSEPIDISKKVIFLAAVDGARFKRPVRPGDRLDLEMTVLKHKGTLWKLGAEAKIDGQKSAEAELLAMTVDR
ncbi:MAG TPA: 3-hydroxyacyl-ACP dehydratase FabZ, partial [Vulgatibacter sp.]